MNRLQRFERDFFRSLNSVVEPAVRKGVGSFRWTPGKLIVLESTGFKSGQKRRTPLLAFRVGKYHLVSTGRGKRSFWPKNLEKQPEISYYLGGKRYSSTAVVIKEEQDASSELPGYARAVANHLASYTSRGWAFALLP